MFMIEEWKDIVKYEGHYQVSNLGRVKSIQRFRMGNSGSPTLVRERILKPKTDRYGYLVCGLSKEGILIHMTVHRLVAFAFVTNSDPIRNLQINHIDGNKQNNIYENLEWCDAKHNQNEALRLGLRGGKAYRPRIDSRPIIQFYGGNIIKTFENLASASRETGIIKTAINNCLAGRSMSSGGFQWEYAK
jgi:hypothetical protein